MNTISPVKIYTAQKQTAYAKSQQKNNTEDSKFEFSKGLVPCMNHLAFCGLFDNQEKQQAKHIMDKLIWTKAFRDDLDYGHKQDLKNDQKKAIGMIKISCYSGNLGKVLTSKVNLPSGDENLVMNIAEKNNIEAFDLIVDSLKISGNEKVIGKMLTQQSNLGRNAAMLALEQGNIKLFSKMIDVLIETGQNKAVGKMLTQTDYDGANAANYAVCEDLFHSEKVDALNIIVDGMFKAEQGHKVRSMLQNTGSRWILASTEKYVGLWPGDEDLNKIVKTAIKKGYQAEINSDKVKEVY